MPENSGSSNTDAAPNATKDFLSQVTDFSTAAANIYKAFGSQPQAQAPTPSAAPASSSSWTQYLPWAIGGVVLLVVLGFVFKK